MAQRWKQYGRSIVREGTWKRESKAKKIKERKDINHQGMPLDILFRHHLVSLLALVGHEFNFLFSLHITHFSQGSFNSFFSLFISFYVLKDTHYIHIVTCKRVCESIPYTLFSKHCLFFSLTTTKCVNDALEKQSLTPLTVFSMSNCA